MALHLFLNPFQGAPIIPYLLLHFAGRFVDRHDSPPDFHTMNEHEPSMPDRAKGRQTLTLLNRR